MATTATVLTLAGLSVLGFTVGAVMPAQAGGELPLKDLTNAGSALLMLVALVVVLRFVATDRTENAAERAKAASALQTQLEKAAEERTREAAAQRAHVEKVTEKFAETTTQLFAAVREDAATARRDLQDFARERTTR
jgi:C4-dicarboxylate-specific signal transduction histidine kinase